MVTASLAGEAYSDESHGDTRSAESGHVTASGEVPTAEYRIWSDRTGQFTVEAVFVTQIGGKVTLRRKGNGQEISLRLEQLSQEDQEWIKALARKRLPPPLRSANEQGDLNGKWQLTSAIAGGEGFPSAYDVHRTWEFKDGRATLSGLQRQLWFKVDTSVRPMRLDIYNKVGTRTINSYACIFRFHGNDLVVCFEAGDEAPSRFRAGVADSSIMLTFRRVGGGE